MAWLGCLFEDESRLLKSARGVVKSDIPPEGAAKIPNRPNEGWEPALSAVEGGHPRVHSGLEYLPGPPAHLVKTPTQPTEGWMGHPRVHSGLECLPGPPATLAFIQNWSACSGQPPAPPAGVPRPVHEERYNEPHLKHSGGSSHAKQPKENDRQH